MSAKEYNYYLGGNTAKGFVSLFEPALEGLDRVYILKGGPGNGKSTVIRQIGSAFAAEGLDVEWIHCASDNGSLDGVVIPRLKAAVVDGTAPHVLEPRLPGIVGHYVNLGEAWDVRALQARRTEAGQIRGQIERAYSQAYGCFAEALRIHDEWESFYIHNLNTEAADSLTEEITLRLFEANSRPGDAKETHRFLGAATPQGAVDYVENLTQDMVKRYFIKGRPGSGKSTMLKKLAAAGKQRGFDVQIYHCGFDPDSLDMLIFPQLGAAIFDSTAPHEHFPARDSDEIIDMYERIIAPGTDEAYELELQDVRERYSRKMKEGTACLAEARSCHRQLEQIYGACTDYRIVEGIGSRILMELQQLAEDACNTP